MADNRSLQPEDEAWEEIDISVVDDKMLRSRSAVGFIQLHYVACCHQKKRAGNPRKTHFIAKELL